MIQDIITTTVYTHSSPSDCMTQQRSSVLEMITMCTHVTIQVAALRESCVTDLALVRLLPRMGPVMLGEGGAVGKTLATGTAFVRPIPRVGPHVGGHGTALGEPAVAHRTLEGLLSAMSAQMSSEVSRLRKRLLTNGALVRFLSRVRAKVRLQSGLPSVRFAADMAGIGALKGFICPL